MQINLPILNALADCDNILICGAGGGFDVYAGLPVYFDLQARGKNVHLANFSFTNLSLAKATGMMTVDAIDEQLVGLHGQLNVDIPYFPEGYLADWFAREDEGAYIWMFPRPGVQTLIENYEFLREKLELDALILVDGGVDSLMRGNESNPGTMTEDSVSLAAANEVDFDVKIIASVGFGTEVEERLGHYAALENMATYIKAGGFYGSCALTPQMPAFQRYEAACRHAWEGDNRHQSHISTRIIPAVRGEFGDYHMYEKRKTELLISPLMSLYWFFDASVVAEHNLIIPEIMDTHVLDDVHAIINRWVMNYDKHKIRQRKRLPY